MRDSPVVRDGYSYLDGCVIVHAQPGRELLTAESNAACKSGWSLLF